MSASCTQDTRSGFRYLAAHKTTHSILLAVANDELSLDKPIRRDWAGFGAASWLGGAGPDILVSMHVALGQLRSRASAGSLIFPCISHIRGLKNQPAEFAHLLQAQGVGSKYDRRSNNLVACFDAGSIEAASMALWRSKPLFAVQPGSAEIIDSDFRIDAVTLGALLLQFHFSRSPLGLFDKQDPTDGNSNSQQEDL